MASIEDRLHEVSDLLALIHLASRNRDEEVSPDMQRCLGGVARAAEQALRALQPILSQAPLEILNWRPADDQPAAPPEPLKPRKSRKVKPR